MKNKKLILGMAVALVLLITSLAVAFFFTRPDVQKGNKEISVTVAFADKSTKEYKIHTKAEFLADALMEEQIITEKSKDGMYTVIAGERADYNLDKSWWCLTKNGNTVNVGINDQPIADGDKYEITNTPS